MNKILKAKKIAIILFLVMVMLSQTIFVLGDLQYKLRISEAGYADLDSGGSPNDVFINFDINISQISNTASKLDNQYTLNYTLKLPSGKIYEYFFTLKFTKSVSDYTYQIINYNVVTETGMYKANLELFDSSGLLLAKGNIVFDPPTLGTGGPISAVI